ncbi:MAG: HesA/MoeB/ThiF family protein [Planctomycetes bacterium]|nr:HesA/MoeB/ThiF family protein [Planctomycetota bacterium]
MASRQLAEMKRRAVAVVGCGGLGCPAAEALARAGVGRLTLIDFDRVELGNLHRQPLHGPRDVGRLKVESAAAALGVIAPGVEVLPRAQLLTAENARDLLAEHDVAIDATDNFPAKYAVADACLALGLPLVHAGVLRWGGQVMTIVPGRTACYRCVFREPPAPGAVPACSQAGVLGAVAGVVGALQAREALALLRGRWPASADALLVYDGARGGLRRVAVARQADCPACGAPSGSAPRAPGQLHIGRVVCANSEK